MTSREKIAYLFPGQGSAFVRMGEDLWSNWTPARVVYEQIADVTGVSVAAISTDLYACGAPDVETAHVAIFAHSLAAHAVLNAELTPSAVAGHSLGMLAAATAAGALSLKEGACLVRRRGALLREACRRSKGGMLAVRGVPFEIIERSLAAQPDRILRMANFNGRDDVVVSGELEGLRSLFGTLKSIGAAVRLLDVQGAFHSPLMAEAAEEFAKVLDDVPLRDPRVPLVSSATGHVLETAQDVRTDLARQMTEAVRWDHVLDTLRGIGIDRWIEVGPGRVLISLGQRWDRRMKVSSTTSSTALRNTLDLARKMREH